MEQVQVAVGQPPGLTKSLIEIESLTQAKNLARYHPAGLDLGRDGLCCPLFPVLTWPHLVTSGCTCPPIGGLREVPVTLSFEINIFLVLPRSQVTHY